jgi:hypothetical protein
MSQITLSEEDLRAKLLLPYLSGLGIATDQIDVERIFRLRLGRRTHEYKSEEIAGRLDVLVRSRDGKNLFVVELKRPHLTLSDVDRDQGISYARLLDQIAPFVLVTNGRESHLYDSISREEIRGGFAAVYGSFQARVTMEDIRIRYEALKHFVGYSAENVAIFSRCQQADRMTTLRGNAHRRDLKYIPDLYYPRQQLREAFNRFMAGSGSVFAITGESGVGKTNEMCALAEEVGNSHIALFFSAGAIPTTLTEVLVDDFNWHFSEELRVPALVRRLADIAACTGKPVLIFVDALDEAPMHTFAHSISDFALHLANFGGKVRLIVSIKSSDWNRFAQFRGTPSALANLLDDAGFAPGATGQKPQPFLLMEWTDAELKEIERKYQQVFHLHSLPSGRLRTHCRLPFFLRVVSEVYGGHAEDLPRDISEAELIRQWLDRKLLTTTNPDGARLELSAVARAAYEQALADDQQSTYVTLETLERVPENAILQELGNPGRSISQDLIAQGILLRHQDMDRRISFSFYYRQVRDYLIARQVLRLDQLRPAEFAAHIDALLSSYILQGALSWHLRDAPATHMDEMRKALRGRALLYVDTYNRIFDEVLPGLKSGVEPYTSGAIGMAYDVPAHGMSSYALYSIGPRQPQTIIEVQQVPNGSWDAFADVVRPFDGYARGGGRNFSNTEPQLASAEFAHEQTKKAIKEGRLDDLVSDELLIEACNAIAIQFRDRLSMPLPTREDLFHPSAFPIDLQDLDRAIQAHFGTHFYRNQWTNEQQLAGNSPYVRRTGSIAITTMDPAMLRETELRAEKEAREGNRFPVPNFVDDADFYRLLPVIVERLRARGIQQIYPALPTSDEPRSYSADAPLSVMYSDQQLGLLIEKFFVLSLEVYKNIIDHNFAGLRSHFETYSRLPLDVLVQYNRPSMSDRRRWKEWGELRYAFLPAKAGIGTVRVSIGKPLIQLRPEDKEFVDDTGQPLIYGCCFTDLYNLLRPSPAPGFTAAYRSSSYAGENAPIRAFAYELLSREFSPIEASDLLAVLPTTEVL